MTTVQRAKSRATILLTALCVGGAGLSAGPAAAQNFPAKPITLVVNWPAGGSADAIGRLIAAWASKRVAVPIVVANITGAAGANGTRRTAESEPDGYTVGVIHAAFVVRTYLNRNATPLDDVDPIAFVGTDPGALEVRTDTGIKSVRQYVDTLRARPGSIANGNDPPGGAAYMMAARLEKFFDIDMSLVPYQGYAPTVAALISGEVESATVPVNQVIEHYKAGLVAILAVAGEQRSFQAPDVPTFKELGFDFVAGDWSALVLPNGVPSDRKAYLETLFLDTMTDPAFQEAARTAGFLMTPLPADKARARIRAYDEEVYPILVDAKLIKVRAK